MQIHEYWKKKQYHFFNIPINNFTTIINITVAPEQCGQKGQFPHSNNHHGAMPPLQNF